MRRSTICLSNNAYMLITSLAWNLKAWFALCLPGNPLEADPKGKAAPRSKAEDRNADC